MSAAPVVPEELLFQGSIDVLVPGRDSLQEWGRRYLCVWCNPPCFALFVSDMAAKRPPEYYVSLPPDSEWHEDTDFQGAPPGSAFRLEAQVGRAPVLRRVCAERCFARVPLCGLPAPPPAADWHQRTRCAPSRERTHAEAVARARAGSASPESPL